MTCGEAVLAYLKSLGPVTALVATKDMTCGQFHQSPTKPAILVTQIDDVQQPHLRGTVGIKMARIQTDVISPTMASARAVDRVIQGDYSGGAATGLRGTTFTIGSPAVSVWQAIADNYREWYDAEELKQYRVTRDYRVWYEG